MKKKTILFIASIVVVLALSAVLTIVLVQNAKKNQTPEEKGNVLGISWYNEKGDSFTIRNKEQLKELVELSSIYTFENQTIYLGRDIVWNEGEAKDWKEKAPKEIWKPINQFAGTFDGKGHTISGLYATCNAEPMALFTNTAKTCEITNLKLTNSYFKTEGNGGVASFVSRGGGKFSKLYSDAIFVHDGEMVGGIGSNMNQQAAFSECWFAGTIESTRWIVGGIVDYVNSPRIQVLHCLFSGTIYQNLVEQDKARTGGIIGYVEEKGGCNVIDSLSIGKIESTILEHAGSVVGASGPSSTNFVKDTYSTQTVLEKAVGYPGGSFAGCVVFLYDNHLLGKEPCRWSELDFDTYWAARKDKTPILKCFAKKKDVLNVKNVKKAYDTSWYDENEQIFTITTKEQLFGMYYVLHQTDFKEKVIFLGADIVINEGDAKTWATKPPKTDWYPIALAPNANAFRGTFDGKGNTISGLYCVTRDANTGLFGTVATAGIVRNLKLTNSYFKTQHEENGGIAGTLRGQIIDVKSDAILDTTDFN